MSDPDFAFIDALAPLLAASFGGRGCILEKIGLFGSEFDTAI